MYFVRTPYIIKKIFPSILWNLPNNDNAIYLTFDDGPHPQITPWILEQLKIYNAKATFFCLGKNVEKYPEIIEQILEDGHTIGNHGYAHLNGWETNNAEYLEDYLNGQETLMQFGIYNNLFRPAYGKIKKSQILNLKSQIINWSLMPGDFDQHISSEKCYKNLINNIKVGDIIVLHDNEKSWKHLEYCLPRYLNFLQHKNMTTTTITITFT